MKAIRCNLFSAPPLPWEVYDLADDRAENRNLASKRRDFIEQAVEVLKKEYKQAADYKALNFLATNTDAAEKPGMNVFRRLDSNKDDTLSFEEWKESPKAKSNPGRLRQIFSDLDKDHDNSLNIAEFTAQFRK
jgi:hypothetical protein